VPGAWQANQERRRKIGRTVIRAMNAYMEAGGRYGDIDKMKVSGGCALGIDLDPLGFCPASPASMA
jgi:hypothetical protein